MKKSNKNNNNPKSEVRKDRKSGTGLSGSPKKGGHGGKFTWVGDGYSEAEIGFEKEAVDVKDPNFEDPEEIQTFWILEGFIEALSKMDSLPTSQHQQLNQMTMQNIQTILCIGCTDFGVMTMLVMASYWPEKQFVVADDNQDVINALQYQDLPVFEPEL
ncbi:hypothetical protein POTOM_043360 [Populus tomentosa]|uniref:Uncharacterized protein n=1 Tax=Populus tomentosa TaxID=118781 RepID=A0A8X7YHD2_POPTO|nr:hypothetical protein POTOM_043360 [Populus tomentosa]